MAVIHHCCHEECDCQRTRFNLDLAAIEEAAIERGVALPVLIEQATYIPLPDAAPDETREALQDDEGAFISALVEHFADGDGWGTMFHHRITLTTGRTAQETIQDVLHELEHCVQAESCPTAAEWREHYTAFYEDYEAAAIAAEDDWEAYGHLLMPREET